MYCNTCIADRGFDSTDQHAMYNSSHLDMLLLGFRMLSYIQSIIAILLLFLVASMETSQAPPRVGRGLGTRLNHIDYFIFTLTKLTEHSGHSFVNLGIIYYA